MAVVHKKLLNRLGGRSFCPYFKDGVLINNKFLILRLIGAGGFGQIFRAQDVEFKFFVAMKASHRLRDPARMILEQKVLLLLSDTKHSPTLLASGTNGNYMYIVMELLGKNLTDLRRCQPFRRFTVETTLRIGQQCISAIKAIHNIGFLHRDLKPSNICIGAEGINRHAIYIVDFGMTRQFRDSKGNIRHERQYAGFRGTTRYASITVHNRHEQGPVDDLWSLLYSLIELGEGSLPWRLISDPFKVQRIKLETNIQDMCRNLPKEISHFADYLRILKFDEMPNYARLTYLLQCLLPSDVNSETLYIWE